MEEKFAYTYSAPTEPERREIESIKNQYVEPPKTDEKLDGLRKLNEKVNRPPLIVAVIIGVVGTLVMGLGMTMVLEWNILVWGIVVGVVGVGIAAAAYPVYRAILGKLKKKYGKQIVDLSNELLNTQK